MTKTHVSPGVINATVVALRFFFKVTLERDDLVRRLTLVSEPRRVPIVLSPEEVARPLTAAPGVKYRAALGVAYGAGLRVSEVVALKVTDIDRERMLLRVEQGCLTAPDPTRRNDRADRRPVGRAGIQSSARTPGLPGNP